MDIKTLENIDVDRILECFNKAFSDYQTPMQLTLAQLENKILSDNIRLEYSIGAFEKNQLIGFILHGYDEVNNGKTLYNAATGVIPDHRGQGITEQLYSFALPVFREKGVGNIFLEVIAANERAVKVYKRVGFTIARKLNCYKGNIATSDSYAPGYDIKKIEACNWEEFESFWDFEPTWQNSVKAIKRDSKNQVVWGIYQSEVLAGYIVYNPDRKRVQLFAVSKAFRRKNLASSLFKHTAQSYSPEISVINVDDNAIGSNEFLRSIGLQNYIQQYEMTLSV